MGVTPIDIVDHDENDVHRLDLPEDDGRPQAVERDVCAELAHCGDERRRIGKGDLDPDSRLDSLVVPLGMP